ncbi:MAG: hypothetical protein LBC19_07360 [Tannerella sp.]|jgi:hypothetical protein|nr:hypothetical protein [Tannerella sp.]
MENFKFNFVTLATAIISTLFIFNCCCKDSEPDTLTISKTQFTFDADDTETQSATITTSASDWSFKSSDSWVTAFGSENTLNVSVQRHSDIQNPRTATITVEAGNAEPALITIRQNAKNSLSISPESLTYESNEIGDKTVSITTNASSWDATTDASWVSLSKQGNTFKVTVSTMNTATSPRTAKITITAGNAEERTLTVTQAAAHTLFIDPSSLSFSANETGEKPVTIETTAPNWSATANYSWVKLNKQDNRLLVSVEANSGSSSRSATVRISAGTAPDRTLTVTQAEAVPVEVTYNSCLAYYYGTIDNSAFFVLDLYNSSSPYTGIMIFGFGTIPECPRKFVLPTGTYPVNLTGSVRSCFAGTWYENEVIGTYTYVNGNPKYLVTGGSLTIESSGSGYAISTNFSGEDAYSSAGASGIRIKYTGSISFTDRSDEPDCVTVSPYPNGNYSATGTPILELSGGSSYNATSWSGTVVPNTTSGTPSYFTITNWGNRNLSFYCDYKGGKYILDTKTKIGENSTHSAYLCVGYKSGNTVYISDYNGNEEYPVSYNSSTRTFDFSSTLNGRSAGVGIVAINKQTGEPEGYFTNLYTNAKLVLSSTSSAPRSGENTTVKNAGIMTINPVELKKSTIKIISAPVTTQSNAVDGKELLNKDYKNIIRKQILK